MAIGKLVREISGCQEGWRLWTQPTWTLPERGDFDLKLTDLNDEVLTVNIKWDHKASDLEETIRSETGWLMSVFGGPINSQCFVFKGHRIKAMKIKENNLHDARPYIWTEYNENSS